MKFEHKVTAATWDEDQGKWHVHVQGPDVVDFVDTCDVLINGGGVLK